jgi:GTP-binding protein
MAIIAIVGSPNVGKSTLFNRISKSKQALVDDLPGVTRDRNYATAAWDEKTFTLVDTGGFISSDDSIFDQRIREQIFQALAEADILLFVGDGKSGLHPEDPALFDILRRTSKPIFFSVNKIDGPEQQGHLADFYSLGVQNIYPISAAHGFGIGDLLSDIVELVPESRGPEEDDDAEVSEIRVSILGRPNVGKSTLVNRILNAPRVIVSPIPGTTRDAVDTPFERAGQRYLLIDTAGIRKKGKTREKLEKISIIKALQTIDRSHVCVLLIDAAEGNVADQDQHIAGYIQERGRACIIGVNKWDAFDPDLKARKNFLEDLRWRFRFMPFAPPLTFSALSGKGVHKLIPAVQEVFGQYNSRISTGILNRALQEAVNAHEPPMVRGRRLKFYYGTQTGTRPPEFVLFCNNPTGIHFSYERFLINRFRDSFHLDKTPIKLVFRGRKQRDKKE